MLGELIVVLIRLAAPLLIIRFSLIGAVVVTVFDYYDINLATSLGLEDFEGYQIKDKILDLYMLSVAFFVSLSWKNKLAKNTSIILFGYRLVGTILFLIFNQGILLLSYPDIFWFFFIFYIAWLRFFKTDPITSIPRLLLIVALLTSPKLLHEYFLHVNTASPWTENRYIKLLLNSI